MVRLAMLNIGLGLWCLMPLSTMFQLYRGSFIDGRNWKCTEKTTHLSQATVNWKTL